MHGGWRPWCAQGSSETYIVAPAGVVAARARAVGERGDLGVRAAELGVEALADHLAVADDHRADQRVRADSAAAALGQLEGPPELGAVRVCGDESHRNQRPD